MFQKNSKSARVYTKKAGLKSVNFVVCPSPKTWNTFFDYVFEWYPVLKEIYY